MLRDARSLKRNQPVNRGWRPLPQFMVPPSTAAQREGNDDDDDDDDEEKKKKRGLLLMEPKIYACLPYR
jgi:hypothetical protein